MDTTIKIELSEIEAERFVEFQKYHEVFMAMFKSGIFVLKNGSATLHFDVDGKLRKINLSYDTYRT